MFEHALLVHNVNSVYKFTHLYASSLLLYITFRQGIDTERDCCELSCEIVQLNLDNVARE